MSEMKSLKKKLAKFVKSLTEEDVRHELLMAYLQMERCQQVLRGDDVEPVTMADNGESSDLELFYLCKKVRSELDGCCESDGGKVSVGIDVSVTADDGILECLRSICEGEPSDDAVDAVRRYSRLDSDVSDWNDIKRIFFDYVKRKESPGKFAVGDDVWYMFGDRIQRSKVKGVERDADGMIIYRTEFGHETIEDETFPSLDELIDYLNDTVHGEDD